MQKNMGPIDRLLRTLVALVVIVLLVTGRVAGVPAIVLGILALVFLATSVMGSCPLYRPLKVSTLKKKP